jgi:hypothetical protein
MAGDDDFTSAPTATRACVDSPEGWYDSDGSTYNCQWYSNGDNCARYGNYYANFGKTANQARLWRRFVEHSTTHQLKDYRFPYIFTDHQSSYCNANGISHYQAYQITHCISIQPML